MRLTEFKKIAIKSGGTQLKFYNNLIAGGKIIEKRKDSARRIKVAIDNRTFIENNTFHIYPIAAFDGCCFIIFPPVW